MSLPPELAGCLRLCSVVKRPDFDGYGFNLHAEKGKLGQFVGKVDEDSPAQQAGLREGDRIVQVNGRSVADENHKQVVLRIKSMPDRTELLVIDAAGDAYCQLHQVPFGPDAPFVVRLCGPGQPSPPVCPSPPVPVPSHQDLKNGDKKDKPVESQPPPEPYRPIIGEGQNNSLNLNMTAQELRARLAARKKYDPKKDCSLDVRKKYDIVQKL